MKRHSIAVTLGLALLAFAICAAAQVEKKSDPAAPLAGTWTCTAHGGSNGDIPFTLDLEQQGETVTGSVSSSMGDAEISSGTFSKGALEIHINGGDTTYTLSGKLDNGQLSGNWSSDGGEKGTWEGKKGSDDDAQKPAQR
ncbi:MAG TPA: hypothetical protein VL523_17140 [Terriglobia bacterium]|nr:hypothetical protein [Terriglobia bacterium]